MGSFGESTGIRAGGSVSIRNITATITVVGGNTLKAPGIESGRDVDISGLKGTFSSYGSPAVVCRAGGLIYGTAYECWAGGNADDIQADPYTGQKYLRVVPRKIDLYLKGNEGTSAGGEEVTQTKEYGDYVNSNDFPAFTRSGHELIGWSTERYGVGGTWYGAKGEHVYIDSEEGSMTLYAQWQPVSEPYRILFDASGATFQDGRGAYAVGFQTGAGLTIPDMRGGNSTLLGWVEADVPIDEDTTWYFPGSVIHPSGNLDLHAQWLDQNAPYVEYRGVGGQASGGNDILYQTMDELDMIRRRLELFSSDTFTRGDGKDFGGWNTEEDWSGESYAGSQIIPINEDTGRLTLYAMWGGGTTTKLSKWKDYCYYTGFQVEPPIEANVQLGAEPAKVMPVQLDFYPGETSEDRLPETPVNVGTYWVEARYPGDRGAGWLPSVSEYRISFEIKPGKSAVVFPERPVLQGLWTGEDLPCLLLDPPRVTLNGVEADLPMTLAYNLEGDPLGRREGLPSAAGNYILYSTVEATDNYWGAQGELPLTVSNFVSQGNVVTGNVDLMVTSPQAGTATAVVALYDKDTHKVRAVTQRTGITLTEGENTIRLRDLSLSAYDGTGDTVKIILLDSLAGLKPLSEKPFEFTVA